MSGPLFETTGPPASSIRELSAQLLLVEIDRRHSQLCRGAEEFPPAETAKLRSFAG